MKVRTEKRVLDYKEENREKDGQITGVNAENEKLTTQIQMLEKHRDLEKVKVRN